MSIQPLGHRVLVQAIEQDEVIAGGIIIPDSAKEKPQESKVIALGTGGKDEKGNVVVFDVKVGDTILTQQYGGTTVKDGDEEYSIYDHSAIIAIVK